MNRLFLPSAENPAFQWLAFVGFLLLLFICLGGFVVWLKVLKRRKPKRKRKHRHRRDSNPTLAQTSGLPPRRDPNQPPPGP
jgi:hypothetical protein